MLKLEISQLKVVEVSRERESERERERERERVREGMELHCFDHT